MTEAQAIIKDVLTNELGSLQARKERYEGRLALAQAEIDSLELRITTTITKIAAVEAEIVVKDKEAIS